MEFPIDEKVQLEELKALQIILQKQPWTSKQTVIENAWGFSCWLRRHENRLTINTNLISEV
jgi:hypothetical protein